MRIPDTISKRLHHIAQGNYTPNRVLLFLLFVIIGLIPFLGQKIVHPAQSIENHALRKIYTALTEPLAAAGMRFPTAAVIPAVRAVFLQSAGLTHEAAWDSFFYSDAVYAASEFTEHAAVSGASTVAERNILHESSAQGSAAYSTAANAAADTDEKNPAGTPHVPEKQKKRPYYIEQKIIPFSAEHPLRLLFFGDSQMHFIASGMKRALGTDPRISIEEISIHSSGFLRSDYYNWPKKLESVFTNSEQQPFHAAVMILGMNDYQDIVTEKGLVLQVGSSDWETVYRAKMQHHIAAVLGSVPRLYWLGLPVVRSEDYNKKIQYLDSLQRGSAAEYTDSSVIKVSLQNLIRKQGVGYINTIQSKSGASIQFMQSDGIHYSIPGCEYLMQQFLTILSDDYLLEDLSPHTAQHRE